jgi:hypothetical protein
MTTGPFGVAAVCVALLTVSACSSGAADRDEVASAGDEASGASPAGTEGTAALDEGAQALRFAECMRDNGVDMPDPGPGQQGLADAFQAVAGDYDRATLRRAIAACEGLMPQYASDEQHTEGWELDLAECLRDQGLEVSDQPFDDAHSGAVDVNEFSAAMEVCREVLIRGGQ